MGSRDQVTESAAALRGQLDEVREVVLRDAEAAGIDRETVDAAIATAVSPYSDATIHAFVGILVERAAREALGLPRKI